MSLNDKAWEVLFERYQILDEVNRHGFYEIDAKTIKTVREPRLMAKFDHKSNLPKIFKKYGISILPISRSRYVLGQFDAYEKVSYDESLRPIKLRIPPTVMTIDPSNLYSESSALHCAYVSGMIADLLGEECTPTVSGRMSSQAFDFMIRTNSGKDHQIAIKNAQVEIDGGYEGEEAFALIEAKKETVEDFLVRQMYYPFRLWQGKIQKKVRPIFFTHSADVFHFFVYEFEDPLRYNSLRLIEQKKYMIAHETIALADIYHLLQQIKVIGEPEIPFPQADSFIRIIDLLGLLMEKDLTKDFITTNYNFDERQTNYYTSAAMYLGLIDKYKKDSNIKYTLTAKGRQLMRLPYKQKYLALIKCILEHKVFNEVVREYFANGKLPSKQKIIEMMKKSSLYNVEKESTYFRRSSTVIRWVEWIIEQQN
ncbi:type II restriction enzyme [Metabacillus niabensis]|uniref:type II restriction enzyme n=1 Tax=Metabacillus niabensis TaxID=324854 RepID=UPI0039A0C287